MLLWADRKFHDDTLCLPGMAFQSVRLTGSVGVDVLVIETTTRWLESLDPLLLSLLAVAVVGAFLGG